MSKKWLRRAGFMLVLVCVLLTAYKPAVAATAYNETDIRNIMKQAFVNGESEVSITVERTFSVNAAQARQEAEAFGGELCSILNEVALQNGKLMNGTSYSWVILDNHTALYKFDISSQFTKKVTVLTSEKEAYKYALKALKNRDYKTSFYAEDAMYFDTFVLAMQHHPEYNYAIMVCKRSDGTFSYQPSSKMSVSAIKTKMSKANTKANAIIKKIIKKGMTRKQKLKAIHDYLVRYCVYEDDDSIDDDAYTAYGCLIKKSAVCQGYAAAFNLLAQKAGIPSIAVCGYAGGISHAWNYVKNGSGYYYIDTTWDDPVPDQGSKAAVSQKYFYLTQKQLEKKYTHSWDKTENAKKYVDYSSIL